MMTRALIAFTVVAAAAAAGLAAQGRSSAGPPRAATDVAAALKTVVPDLDRRLARFKVVRMPYNSGGLTSPERAD